MSRSEHAVLVTALGAAGDGIAAAEGRRVFVPGALPGERWRVRLGAAGDRAAPLECLEPVARAEPPCRHFGRCGGCRLQHLTTADYAAFKRQRIVDALARQGLPTDCVTEVRIGPPASRRRLRLAVKRGRSRVWLGLRERSGHEIVPLEMCTVAEPALVTLLAPLGEALASWLTGPWPAEASLTLTDAGPDLLLHAARTPLAAERAAAAAMASSLGLARIAWQSTVADARCADHAAYARRPAVGDHRRAAARGLPAGHSVRRGGAGRRGCLLGRGCAIRGRPLCRRRHPDLGHGQPCPARAGLRERSPSRGRPAARGGRPKHHRASSATWCVAHCSGASSTMSSSFSTHRAPGPRSSAPRSPGPRFRA